MRAQRLGIAAVAAFLGLGGCGGKSDLVTVDSGDSGVDGDSGDSGGGDSGDSGGGDSGDSGGDTGDSGGDSGDSGGGDSGSDSGDSGGDSGDTGVVGDDGLVSWVGEADVDGHWEGSESVRFVGNSGLGDTLCDVRYPLTTLRERDDCAECVLAFDVAFGAPEVRVDTYCAAAGYDAATIAAREGEERAYGFALNYLGHANVLMRYDGSRWEAVSFVDWNEAKLRITYDWEQGYVSY